MPVFAVHYRYADDPEALAEHRPAHRQFLRELLERDIGRFFVIESEGNILGCAALYPFAAEKTAELAAVAVNPFYRDGGRGERLLAFAEARARFGRGGPFLFGTFGAADVFYAPVVSRFVTYGIGVPGFAQAYMEAMWEHEWLQAWVKAAEDEQWVIEQWDTVPAL